ncbi:MAG: adenylate/guanylate cyclase domain-containing protein [Leptospiraceae bacterium]|nr:adenylate/guanylate cyclase domain-containing protein [Leptospiraceae bacterium]
MTEGPEKGLRYHWRVHAGRRIKRSAWVTAAALLLAAGALHAASYLLAWEAARSFAPRLYYAPVLYATWTLGAWRGLAVTVTAATALSGVNYSAADLPLEERTIAEWVTLVLFFLVVGFLRDHETHERDKRQEVRNLFNCYVSSEVVDRILDGDISFSGNATMASVLFSDIRGFTTYAETREPEVLLKALNTFFSGMVRVILERTGYIDKFIGDAVMAVFGVPFGADDDAERAVLAAIDMQHALRRLNQAGAFGPEPLTMGIGIHTGLLVAGNVGSPERMQYTVIGDAVNLASRIESLNKLYGTHLLISDATYKAVRENTDLRLREVDAVRVKGRHTPVTLYEVYNCCANEEVRLKDATLGNFIEAMALYRSGQWQACERALTRVLVAYPTDPISQMYRNRIATLRKRTPQKWDGVFDLSIK